MDQKRIGSFIATMRKEQGMTQEQLGERLGVTNKTVSRWETGKYMPDIDKLQMLSVILGISINELLAGDRMEDFAEFAQKADETLVAALSADSAFGLQDRIVFYKRKWLKEHKSLMLSGFVLWCMLFLVGIYVKQPIVLGLLPIAGLAIYAYIRNQMMIYVEDRAFIK